MNLPLTIVDAIVIPAADLSYEFSRAGGPGGQHVNTTDTRVRLRFDLVGCEVLSEAVKERVREARPHWLTDDGFLVLTCDRNRSRLRNVEEVRERLAVVVEQCLKPPKKRRPTRPTKASKTRRLQTKKRRSGVKNTRRRATADD